MNALHENVIKEWGSDGKQWLDALPLLVSALCDRWQLIDVKPFESLSYNYCARARRQKDNMAVVLKIGFDHKSVQQEAQALHFYNGSGAAKLLDIDFQLGALLLEYVGVDGEAMCLKSLFPHDEEKAVLYTVEVIRRLHMQQEPESTALPGLEDVLVDLTKAGHDVPCIHLRQAQQLAFELLSTQSGFVVLHGDLHFNNILKSASGNWCAIDPKGFIGDPAYDVGAFIRSPMPELLQQPNKGAILVKRIQLFSQMLSLDPQRVRDWAYVQAVLAACWTEHESVMLQRWIECADLIAQLS